MNTIDIILILIIAVVLIRAVLVTIHNRTICSGCCGDCSDCNSFDSKCRNESYNQSRKNF